MPKTHLPSSFPPPPPGSHPPAPERKQPTASSPQKPARRSSLPPSLPEHAAPYAQRRRKSHGPSTGTSGQDRTTSGFIQPKIRPMIIPPLPRKPTAGEEVIKHVHARETREVQTDDNPAAVAGVFKYLLQHAVVFWFCEAFVGDEDCVRGT